MLPELTTLRAFVFLFSFVDVHVRRSIRGRLEFFLADRALERSLVRVTAIVNLQVRFRNAALAAERARKAVFASDVLQVSLQKPLRCKPLVAVVLAYIHLCGAFLHVSKLVEVVGERLGAVSALVQTVLVEEFGMFAANVLGEEAHLLSSYEDTSFEGAGDAQGVEKKEVNLHFVIQIHFVAMPATKEPRARSVNISLRCRDRRPNDVVFKSAQPFDYSLVRKVAAVVDPDVLDQIIFVAVDHSAFDALE